MLEMTPHQFASSPVLILLSEPEVEQATVFPAEEEAVLVIRMVRLGPVIAEVATLRIISASLVTRPQTGHGHQVVNCPTLK